MSLEKLRTQEPFESLRSRQPPTRPKDGRTYASVFNLYHPRFGFDQVIERWVF